MEDYIRKMLSKGLSFVAEKREGSYIFRMKKGDRKKSRKLGLKDKNVAEALFWLDNNPREAKRLIK
jgi:hypothetical protein